MRELYRLVFVKNRQANQQCFGYPDGLHRDSAQAIIEALEPRLMLSVTPTLLGPGLDDVHFSGSDAAEVLHLRSASGLLEYSDSDAEGSYTSP